MIKNRKLIINKNSNISISLTAYNNRHAIAWAAQNKASEECGIKILNPLPYLCDETSCYASKEGMPIYYDDDHLSERGGALLTSLFKGIF